MDKKYLSVFAIIVIAAIVGGIYFFTGSDKKNIDRNSESMVSESQPSEMADDKKRNDVAFDETLTLNAEQSTLRWSSQRIIGGGHAGNVSIKSGELLRENNEYVGGNFVIDMMTITEDNDSQRFLGHIASADFFDVANYPEASITLTSITMVEGNNYEIVADLTILGETHEITFPATLVDGDGQVEAQASFEIDRTRWGITYDSGTVFQQIGDKAIKDEIPFEINLVFTK